MLFWLLRNPLYVFSIDLGTSDLMSWRAEGFHPPFCRSRAQNGRFAEKAAQAEKGNLQNIYGKLNVSKRREAAENAKKIGIH